MPFLVTHTCPSASGQATLFEIVLSDLPCPSTSGEVNLHPDGEDSMGQDEEVQPKTVFYPPIEILMESAVLAPSGNGVTPVQAIFASVSPLFDNNSMCLHVSNMPVSYTAQQLLKLFQTRYPSAYKAEIFKVQTVQ